MKYAIRVMWGLFAGLTLILGIALGIDALMLLFHNTIPFPFSPDVLYAWAFIGAVHAFGGFFRDAVGDDVG